MNIRDLEYLVALDECKHFRKAAERCCVSQPTLSGQLKKMEENLGVQLVERSQKMVILTDVGNSIVQRARRILSEVQNIKEVAELHANPMVGELRIGLSTTLAPYLLPIILEPIRQSYPKLTLLLHEDQTETLLKRLEDATLDLIIISIPVEHSGFQEIFLFEEPFFLATPLGHPLATREEVGIEEILNEPVLLLEEGHCLRGQALEICFTANAKERDHFKATSLETIRQMVAIGGGITLIPRVALPEPLTSNTRIRYIPFSDPIPSRQIGMLCRKNSSRMECFAKLEALIKEVMELNEEKANGEKKQEALYF